MSVDSSQISLASSPNKASQREILHHNPYWRLFIVFLLGFSSGLPYSLLGGTLQAWFATSGQTVFVTSMISLLGFPYIFRFFWAPFLDQISLTKTGKRRSWILLSQICLILGFYGMTFFDPNVSPVIFAVLALVLAFCSSTQDSAIDAHRIEYLSLKHHPLGASLASNAYRLGILLSGGYALVMAGSYGWVTTYRSMAVFMLVGIFAVLLSKEPNAGVKHDEDRTYKAYAQALGSIFVKPGTFTLLSFIFFFKLGEVFTSGISGIVTPFLINGLGFSLSTIGYVNKIMGTIALIVGGFVAGVVALRYRLSWLLMVFGIFQALANSLFVALAMIGPNTYWLALAVLSDNFATGLGSTALVALFMRMADKKYTATQFSMLMAFATIPRILSGPFGAWMQHYIGWSGLYQTSVFLALLYIPFWYKLRPYLDQEELY